MRKSAVQAFCLLFCAAMTGGVFAQQSPKFNGIDAGMGNIYRLSDAKTRSISPENYNGGKGEGGKATTGTGANSARDLGTGWKINPCVVIKAKTTFTVAEIDGSGSVQHIRKGIGQ